ncbi:MAG: protein kinase [Vicinamibacterales bacterium]
MSADVMPGGVLDGKYVLLAPIGGGRFGTVYRALHIALQKPVAVKLLHAGDRVAADDFEQFRVEAEALGRLNHPHVVGVTDFGIDPRGEGTPYLVMELVEGRTLEEAAGAGPVDPAVAAPWVAQIAAALDHAHAGGVVHGDLSPYNVLLVGPDNAPVVKVIDFGLARLTGLDQAPPPPDDDAFSVRVTATPAYAPPEQLRGEPPSVAGDVHALAAVAYRLVAGRPPFAGDARSAMHARLTRDPEPASRHGPDVPAALDAVLAGGLARLPAARPATASALADAFAAITAAFVRSRWRRRETPRRLALAAAVTALLVAVGPALSATGIMQRLEGATLDARFAVSPARAGDPRLLLVSIDDASLATDPTPLSARADEFAAVLDAAMAGGTAVAALDLLLPETWARSQQFGDFVLGRASRLVLGLAADETSVVGPEAIDPLVAGALGPDAASRLFGLVTHVPSADGVVRRARTAVTDRRGQARATLAGRVFDLGRGEAPPAPADTSFVVDYAVDATAFERLGWRDFAAAVRRGARYDGRLLLVGAEFTGSGDQHPVPGPGRLTRAVSGLALQAVITDTLLQGRRLRDVPPLVAWATTAGVLAASMAGLLLAGRSRRALSIAAGTAGSAVLLAVAAFLAGWVAPVAVPVCLWLLASGVAVGARRRLPQPPQ